jgi:hypothetical protein
MNSPPVHPRRTGLALFTLLATFPSVTIKESLKVVRRGFKCEIYTKIPKCFARKIMGTHRMLCFVDDQKIMFLRCLGHYDDH